VSVILSIDFESFRHINLYPAEEDDSKFVKSTAKDILSILKKNGVRMTFFVVGELYEKYPEVIESIQDQGHEMAYHTHGHVNLTDIEILKDELKKSRKFISKFRPRGFRAPRMYLKKEHLGMLKNEGFRYDSSIYGTVSSACNVGGIEEIPVSTLPLLGSVVRFPKNLFRSLRREIPIGSGYFIGLLNNSIKPFLDREERKGRTSNIFIHPWQITHFPKNFIRRNIISRMALLPYERNRKNIFENIVSRYNILSFEEYLEKL
jgi:peptidoglycan/xylan/chitin deacetylase (PgdA/CDA1 family)